MKSKRLYTGSIANPRHEMMPGCKRLSIAIVTKRAFVQTNEDVDFIIDVKRYPRFQPNFIFFLNILLMILLKTFIDAMRRIMALAMDIVRQTHEISEKIIQDLIDAVMGTAIRFSGLNPPVMHHNNI